MNSKLKKTSQYLKALKLISDTESINNDYKLIEIKKSKIEKAKNMIKEYKKKIHKY